LTVLAAVSCGTDSLSGRVVLSGSATLAPLAAKAVEAWKKLHPQVDVRIEAIGSDAGLERLVRFHDADLALMSRPLQDEDRTKAQAAGLTLTDLPVAWDGVCLVVPTSNTWAHGLTRAQTALAFTTARLWSDLDPSWPAVAIHRFVLGSSSGTADVFAAAVLGGKKGLLYAAPEVQSSEDDRILARGVAQVDGSLGFLGWSTFREVDKTVRALAFDGTAPSPDAIRSGAYGLPRHLWFVLPRDGTTAATRSLVQFLFDSYPAVTADTGLVPLTDAERRTVLATLKTLN
jgi:phosphate transport system substrate-binding protein